MPTDSRSGGSTVLPEIACNGCRPITFDHGRRLPMESPVVSSAYRRTVARARVVCSPLSARGSIPDRFAVTHVFAITSLPMHNCVVRMCISTVIRRWKMAKNTVKLLGAVLCSVLTLPVLPVSAQTCRWDGTAPWCAGECGRGESEVLRTSDLPEHWRA
jgi:hypothetical protein